VREAIVGTLEAHNYRCFTAEDGTDALALYFERREIAIVVTDLHMGMMDGITLTRSLQKLNPHVKVVVSSGHLEKHKRDELDSLGVKHILEKPYTADKLLKALKELINAPKRR
jgi:two-component system, cell cycle sensor histidine kinase and response regulator CckA